jgi:hypothetical protein
MSRSLAELEQYLVGHWRMENNFKDSSGNSNHGTPTDIEWKPTSRGMKPKFNGAGCIEHSATGDFEPTTPTSICAWVKLGRDATNSSESQPVISSKYLRLHIRDEPSQNTIHLRYDEVSARTIKHTLGSGYIDWVHIIGVHDGNKTLSLYVNGILVVSTTQTQLPSVEYGEWIGRYDAGHLYGDIDNSCIYYTTLDATEALTLYNSTTDTHGVIKAERSYTHRLSPPVDNSTTFATDMHTKSGYDLVDLSGNLNNGTVSGAVRSGGYFTDGMRLNGTNNYIAVGDVS